MNNVIPYRAIGRVIGLSAALAVSSLSYADMDGEIRCEDGTGLHTLIETHTSDEGVKSIDQVIFTVGKSSRVSRTNSDDIVASFDNKTLGAVDSALLDNTGHIYIERDNHSEGVHRKTVFKLIVDKEIFGEGGGEESELFVNGKLIVDTSELVSQNIAGIFVQRAFSRKNVPVRCYINF